jgi:hypothetical protein
MMQNVRYGRFLPSQGNPFRNAIPMHQICASRLGRILAARSATQKTCRLWENSEAGQVLRRAAGQQHSPTAAQHGRELEPVDGRKPQGPSACCFHTGLPANPCAENT